MPPSATHAICAFLISQLLIPYEPQKAAICLLSHLLSVETTDGIKITSCQDCTYCWWTTRFSDTFAYKNLVACFGAHLIFTNNVAHQIWIYVCECCCESFLNSQKAHVYLILFITLIFFLVSDTSFYFLNVCHFGSGFYMDPMRIIVSPQNLSCAIATVVDMYSNKANFWNICVL